MARIRKRGKAWHVEVRRIGAAPEYAAFPTKAEAQEWAAEIERKIRQGKHTISHKRTLGDLLEKYAAEVTPKKRGHAWETRRIDWFLRDGLSSKLLTELTPSTLASWRDSRLQTASGETVRRDMNLLSHALAISVREWGWLSENPLKRVSRPAGNPPRERVASDREIEAICIAGGYCIGQKAETLTARVAAAFVFAVETGMRSGEILALSHRSICSDGTAARLERTKNGTARSVALSQTARQILSDVGSNFGITAAQRDALFRKIKDRAGIEGLTFHDARHTAITRLARKLNPLELARMVGHKDLKMLLRYYNESAEEIAKRL